MDYSGKPAKFSEWSPLNMIKLKAYRECVEKIKAYYKATRFAYDAECLCEELDEVLVALVGDM